MKIAIVTGASSGMGKWFSIYSPTYFKDIEEVWLVGRNMNRLLKVASHIKVSTKVFALDLCNADDMKEFKDAINKTSPEIQLLVNSAGMGIIGRFDEMTSEDASSMIRINCEVLTSVIYGCIDYMCEDSRIINLASAAAFICQPQFAVYAATKSYVLSLSQALYLELKPRKIFVTAVCPGCVDTPFFNTAEKYQPIKKYKKLFMANERSVVSLALWDSLKKKPMSVYGLSMNLFYVICKFLPIKLITAFMK